MRRSLLLSPLLLLLGLVTAPGALAGGWATVELSSTPTGVAPGTPWNVDVTVLQHGVTPLAGVTPIVRLRSAGGVTREFAAETTARTGVYRARVIFPAAGRWTYEVDDGFISEAPHMFPAVTIAAPAAPAPVADGGSGVSAGRLAGAGAALVLALAVLAADRRRRRPPLAARAAEPAA